MKRYLLLIISMSIVLLSIYLLLDFRTQLMKCDIGVRGVITNIEIDMIILKDKKDKPSMQELYRQGDIRKDFLRSRAKEWTKAIYILYFLILENIIIFCIVIFSFLKTIFSKRIPKDGGEVLAVKS